MRKYQLLVAVLLLFGVIGNSQAQYKKADQNLAIDFSKLKKADEWQSSKIIEQIPDKYKKDFVHNLKIDKNVFAKNTSKFDFSGLLADKSSQKTEKKEFAEFPSKTDFEALRPQLSFTKLFDHNRDKQAVHPKLAAIAEQQSKSTHHLPGQIQQYWWDGGTWMEDASIVKAYYDNGLVMWEKQYYPMTNDTMFMTEYEYNDAGLMTKQLFYNYEADGFVASSRYSYEYDNYLNMTLLTVEYIENGDWKLSYSEKYTYEYSPMGQILNMLISSYDAYSEQWMDVYKIESVYEGYNLIEEINYYGDMYGKDWTPESKVTYAYEGNMLTEATMQSWDFENEEWRNMMHIVDVVWHEFNGNLDEALPTSYTEQMWAANSWWDLYRYNYEYGEHGSMSETEMFFDGEEWQNTMRNTETYDEHENITEVKNEIWHDETWVQTNEYYGEYIDQTWIYEISEGLYAFLFIEGEHSFLTQGMYVMGTATGPDDDNPTVIAMGQITANDANVFFTEFVETPIKECDGDGVYAYTMNDEEMTLDFTLVQDECQNRIDHLTGGTFELTEDEEEYHEDVWFYETQNGDYAFVSLQYQQNDEYNIYGEYMIGSIENFDIAEPNLISWGEFNMNDYQFISFYDYDGSGCQSYGAYNIYHNDEGGISFDLVEDDCSERVALLTNDSFLPLDYYFMQDLWAYEVEDNLYAFVSFIEYEQNSGYYYMGYTSEFEDDDTDFISEGFYSHDETTATFEDLMEDGCQTTGIYNYTIEDDVFMSFELVSDDCEERAYLLQYDTFMPVNDDYESNESAWIYQTNDGQMAFLFLAVIEDQGEWVFGYHIGGYANSPDDEMPTIVTSGEFEASETYMTFYYDEDAICQSVGDYGYTLDETDMTLAFNKISDDCAEREGLLTNDIFNYVEDEEYENQATYIYEIETNLYAFVHFEYNGDVGQDGEYVMGTTIGEGDENLDIVAAGEYISGEGLIVFHYFNESPCQSEGDYNYVSDDENGLLTFTVIEDACADRVALLDEQTFMYIEDGEEPGEDWIYEIEPGLYAFLHFGTEGEEDQFYAIGTTTGPGDENMNIISFGSYEADDSISYITFTDWEGSGCSMSGSYDFNIGEDGYLTFTLSSDACTARSEILTGGSFMTPVESKKTEKSKDVHMGSNMKFTNTYNNDDALTEVVAQYYDDYSETYQNAFRKVYSEFVTTELSSEKQITAFSIDVFEGTIDEENKEITCHVDDILNPEYVAVFEHSEHSTVTVNGVIQISGETKNNFSQSLEYTVTAQDDTEVTYTVRTFIVGVDEIKSSINIYPTITENNLYINNTSEKSVDFEIYSVNGQKVKRVNDFYSGAIDVSALQSGVYFIKLMDENGEFITRKFVKK